MTARLALLLALSLSLSCGPSTTSGSETTPTLPGDEPVGEEKPAGKKPGKKPAKPEPDPWAGRKDLIQAPAAQPPRAVELPRIERFELPSGLKVLVVVRRDLPVVSFHLAVGAGSSQESRELRGLSDFAAAMLTKGTKKRSADQIAQAIDQVGGSLGAGADYESTHVSCDVLAKDALTCLDLVADVTQAPAFPPKEIDEVRKQLGGAVKQRRDDAQALGEEHFENLLWGEDHVRGWPVTLDTVAAISQKDLQTWHATWFKPGNAVLAIAGDVDVNALKGQVAKSFAPWKKGEAPAEKRHAIPVWKGVRVRVVDHPDLTQSHILVGHLGVAHADPDYLATMVMNYTLGGGGFSSRLMTVIRAQGAKSYGAHSGFDRYRTRGAFMASTFTRSAETAATLALLIGEIKTMRADGPTQAELTDAVSHIAGAYPINFQGAADAALAVLSAELHGLGEGYVRDFPTRVGGVDLAAVKQAARDHLDDKNLVVVIVGNAAEVAPQLQEAGYKFEVVSWLEPVSKRDREERIAARNKPDPKKVEAGKKLLEQALTARGGEKKLRALKEVVARGTLTISAGGNNVQGDYVRYYQAPDRVRIDISIPGKGTLRFVLLPSGGFLELGGEIQELPPEDFDTVRVLAWADGDAILLNAKAPGALVALDEPQDVNGVSHPTLRVVSPDKSLEALVLLDPKTHLVYGVCYGIQGETLCDEYSDYKTVAGLQMPHKLTTINLVIGGLPIDVVFDKVEVNAGLPAKAFDRP